MVATSPYRKFVGFILLPLLILLVAGYFYWDKTAPVGKQPINMPDFENWLQQKQHRQTVVDYQRFLDANGMGNVM
ncbi:MAG: hypothetical protein L3K52_05095 [Candidatus Thiothrix sulfatifontis]|nr:MAG: hypothetical protein L3K52_05095 [Candidatus Thiothrix sulfatifontis]